MWKGECVVSHEELKNILLCCVCVMVCVPLCPLSPHPTSPCLPMCSREARRAKPRWVSTFRKLQAESRRQALDEDE